MGAKRLSSRAVEMFPNCMLINIAGRSDPRIDANEYEQHMGIWTQIMGTSKVVVVEDTETY
jgi:hypothetical protein